MSFFSSNGNSLFTDEDNLIRDKVESFYNEAFMVNQIFQDEANLDARFNAGDQNLISEYYNIPLKTRKDFYVNRIRPVTNMVVGYQRANRKSIVTKPVEEADQNGSDQFSKTIAAILRNCNGFGTISEAFLGGVVSGISLLELYIDYTDDPISGDIKIDNCAYNTFLIDPFFRKKDLSDCNAILKRSFISKEACKLLIPNKEEEIDQCSGNFKDQKFGYMPESSQFNKDLLAYDEFYYRDYRERILLVERDTEKTLEWKKSEAELTQQLLKYPNIEVIKDKIPTVKLAILVNGNVLYNGENPMSLDTYPFIPVFGYFDPNLDDFSLRIQGLVRSMRDSQFLYNRMLVLHHDMIESRSNVGYIYKEDSLLDPDSPFNTQNGMMIRLKQNADMGDFAAITPVDIPSSHYMLSEIHEKNLMYVSGANEELMGMAEDDKSGILAKLRQGQGLITLQTLFDQLDESLELLGKAIVTIVQNNYTPAKIRKIINQDPDEQFYSKVFPKYHISVEEGFDTSIQRNQEFMKLIYLKEKGINIPDSTIIGAATIQNKQNLLNTIEQQNKSTAELEEKQARINELEQQATMNMLNARAEYDKAQAKSKESAIEKDRFDMITGAMDQSRQEQKTNMDAIKILKDLEQSDPNKIDELIELMRIIQQDRDDIGKEIKTGDLAPTGDQFEYGMQSANPIGNVEDPQQQAFQEQMLQPNEQSLQEQMFQGGQDYVDSGQGLI